MRIALASDWFLPRVGGVELQMRDLALQLRSRGHEVEIITGTPGTPEVDGIKIHRVDMGPLLPRFFSRGQDMSPSVPLNFWTLLSDWKACWGRWLVNPLDRLMRERRFDVVHSHSAYSPLALAACWSARRARVPSVLSEHSVLKGAGRALLEAAERTWRWSTWPDVIAAVSNYVANEMRTQTGREVELLPNGINPDDWLKSCGPDTPRVISVMRLMPRKRGIDFVRSIPQVLDRLAWETPPRFTLVGDGPQRRRIEREAAYLGVTGNLEMTGRLERSQVRELLSQSTIFVLPTIKEALSIAVLEALSAGLPIVAMNHGGVGDIITHGREGFLANTHEEFCGYTAQLLSNPELRGRMAAVTRQAATRFSWDGIVNRHLDIYERARIQQAQAHRLWRTAS
jgi:glycosyltransferase involved in cell wall biosynthesis